MIGTTIIVKQCKEIFSKQNATISPENSLPLLRTQKKTLKRKK